MSRWSLWCQRFKGSDFPDLLIRMQWSWTCGEDGWHWTSKAIGIRWTLEKVSFLRQQKGSFKDVSKAVWRTRLDKLSQQTVQRDERGPRNSAIVCSCCSQAVSWKNTKSKVRAEDELTGVPHVVKGQFPSHPGSLSSTWMYIRRIIKEFSCEHWESRYERSSHRYTHTHKKEKCKRLCFRRQQTLLTFCLNALYRLCMIIFIT